MRSLSMHAFTIVLLSFQAPLKSLLMSFKMTREMLELWRDAVYARKIHFNSIFKNRQKPLQGECQLYPGSTLRNLVNFCADFFFFPTICSSLENE